MYFSQRLLSKLAAGIGAVLWEMVYAPDSPRLFRGTPPNYGKPAGVLPPDGLDVSDAWNRHAHHGTSSGGPLSSNIPAAEPFGGSTIQECAASGLGCNMSNNGPNGEYQCRYCGEGPDVSDGCDTDGFPGGCVRAGHTPEDCPTLPIFHPATGSPDALPITDRRFAIADECAFYPPADRGAFGGTAVILDDAPTFVDKAAEAVFAMQAHGGGDLENLVVTTRPDSNYDADALRAKIVKRARREPEPLTDAEHAELNGMLAELQAKPKRIRVRSKPLTDADIVAGGVYVPKRGNDKTPNLHISNRVGDLVAWVRVGDCNEYDGTVADFLALVSRRV